jgi:hypothetical protein
MLKGLTLLTALTAATPIQFNSSPYNTYDATRDIYLQQQRQQAEQQRQFEQQQAEQRRQFEEQRFQQLENDRQRFLNQRYR